MFLTLSSFVGGAIIRIYESLDVVLFLEKRNHENCFVHWNVYFNPVKLGSFLKKIGIFEDLEECGKEQLYMF